jgi:hypothetical protein
MTILHSITCPLGLVFRHGAFVSSLLASMVFQITLDAFAVLLCIPRACRSSISMQCIRFVGALIPLAFGTSLVTLEVCK